MTNVLLTIGMELAFLWFALFRRVDTVYRLRTFAVVNMLAVGLYAPRLLEIGGYRNNISSIFYTFVILSVVALAARHDERTAIRTVVTVLYAMGLAVGLAMMVIAFPLISDSQTAAAINVVIDRSMGVVAASVAAFVVAMSVLIVTVRARRWWSYIAAVLFAQVVDSIVFYPLAFPHLPLSESMDLILTGIVFKLGFSAIAGPFVWAMVRYPLVEDGDAEA